MFKKSIIHSLGILFVFFKEIKMSSSASSRANSQKPKNVKPATDALLKKLGYDEYLFNQVATWETPLLYKGGYETG